MISKELLSDVLGYDADPSLVIEVRGDGIYSPGINIYELAHKCKEWVAKRDLVLVSYVREKRNSKLKGFARIENHQGLEITEEYCENIEPEAIFKACQWILDNKEDN